MTLRRLLANLAAGIVLVVILIGLVIIIFTESAERGRRHGEPGMPFEQAVPFGEGKK
jgi:F0F1-type ATP synthase membrane subunit a